MAKGQKRGNREVKKPKATIKKPVAGATTLPYQLSAKPAPGKPGNK